MVALSAAALRWTKINAYGSSIISGLTVLASLYLLVSLARQGRGKLRVRLLIGMVLSDLLLGIVAIIPESRYLAGHSMITGSRGCDAQAFLLTTIIFTQHLWTLAIATSTFLLLKHPLSRATTRLEKFSWCAAPLIWTISFIHSGLWWRFVGWNSAAGNLCYYAPHKSNNDVDARDLVQFIPRATVFIIICGLYSTLFKFLRRPDTIQLSSQFVSGGVGSGEPAGPVHFLKKTFASSKPHPTPFGPTGSVNPDAPWEQLEFVQIGYGSAWATKPASPVQSALRLESPQSKVINSILLSTPTVSPTTEVSGFHFNTTRRPSFAPQPSVTSTDSPAGISEDENIVTPDLDASAHPKIEIHQPLSPVLSDYSAEGKSQGLLYADEEGSDRRPSGQTMKEFFDNAEGADAERGHITSGGKRVTPLSATAYFNRQASLLMLYFPLAYLIVFSVSLVRLVYDMVNPAPSLILSTLSAWMVLSIGLIDGLVYGFAEFMVRRRVRRKMPDRM